MQYPRHTMDRELAAAHRALSVIRDAADFAPLVVVGVAAWGDVWDALDRVRAAARPFHRDPAPAAAAAVYRRVVGHLRDDRSGVARGVQYRLRADPNNPAARAELDALLRALDAAVPQPAGAGGRQTGSN